MYHQYQTDRDGNENILKISDVPSKSSERRGGSDRSVSFFSSL